MLEKKFRFKRRNFGPFVDGGKKVFHSYCGIITNGMQVNCGF